MNLKRWETVDGVFLTCVNIPDAKEVCLSVNLLTQLSREYAAANAMIPPVLCCGTVLNTKEALAQRFEETGSLTLSPLSRCVGEIQCIGLRSVYTPSFDGKKDIFLYPAASLLAEIFLSPATRGGLFIPSNVDAAREEAEERDAAELSPADYALTRCLAEMCCYEDYSAQFPGGSSVDSFNYKKLSKHYRSLLQSSPVEIIYVGASDPDHVLSVFKDAFSAMPCSERSFDLGTDIRMNAVEDTLRRLVEPGNSDYSVLGCRIGEITEEPDAAVLEVLKQLISLGLTASGCSDHSVFVDRHKGLLLCALPLGADEALNVFDSVIEQIIQSNICGLQTAAENAADVFLAAEKSAAEIENFTLARLLDGPDCSPSELAEAARMVESEEVSAYAASLEKDYLFSLSSSAL